VFFPTLKDYIANKKNFDFLSASVAARHMSFWALLPPRNPLFCLFLAQSCALRGFRISCLCFMVPDACFLSVLCGEGSQLRGVVIFLANPSVQTDNIGRCVGEFLCLCLVYLPSCLFRCVAWCLVVCLYHTC